MQVKKKINNIYEKLNPRTLKTKFPTRLYPIGRKKPQSVKIV